MRTQFSHSISNINSANFSKHHKTQTHDAFEDGAVQLQLHLLTARPLLIKEVFGVAAFEHLRLLHGVVDLVLGGTTHTYIPYKSLFLKNY